MPKALLTLFHLQSKSKRLSTEINSRQPFYFNVIKPKCGIITGSMCAFFVTGENVPDWRIEKTKELFGLAKITILDDFLYIDSQNALFSNEALQNIVYMNET